MDLKWILGGGALDFIVPVHTGAQFQLFLGFQKKLGKVMKMEAKRQSK